MTSKPRDICVVIDRVLALIPSDWTDLREQLQAVARTAGFGAPEVQGHFWRQAGAVLTHHLGKLDPPPEWAQQVRREFAGEVAASDGEAVSAADRSGQPPPVCTGNCAAGMEVAVRDARRSLAQRFVDAARAAESPGDMLAAIEYLAEAELA